MFLLVNTNRWKFSLSLLSVPSLHLSHIKTIDETFLSPVLLPTVWASSSASVSSDRFCLQRRTCSISGRPALTLESGGSISIVFAGFLFLEGGRFLSFDLAVSLSLGVFPISLDLRFMASDRLQLSESPTVSSLPLGWVVASSSLQLSIKMYVVHASNLDEKDWL